jgi:hypothetical protein
MKRKLYTVAIFALLSTVGMAQAVIKQTATPPVLNGVEDAGWANANSYNIVVPFQAEVATVGAPGTTYWKALWDTAGIYILVKVNDDSFYPSYLKSGSSTYDFDKVELYLDVNTDLKDGVGPGIAALGGQDVLSGQGHYQVAPAFKALNVDGQLTVRDNNLSTCFKVTKPTYICEYFIGWSILYDKDSVKYDMANPMGFDVTVIDRDGTPPNLPTKPDRQRVDWSNNGSKDESWANMDGCGTITFEQTFNSITRYSKTSPSNIKVYPSLVSSGFTMELKSFKPTEKVQIFNAIGKMVKEIKVTELKQKVNVEELPSGLYMIQSKTTPGMATKFIKE